MDSCGDSDDEAFFVNMHLAAAVASERGMSRVPCVRGIVHSVALRGCVPPTARYFTELCGCQSLAF